MSVLNNCKEHVLDSCVMADWEMKQVMFDGIGYEVHEKKAGWGWGITFSAKSRTMSDSQWELAKRERAQAIAEEALGLDELLECRECGDHYEPNGDGYDGLCPFCADVKYGDDDDD